jgi:hypothetical protein
MQLWSLIGLQLAMVIQARFSLSFYDKLSQSAVHLHRNGLTKVFYSCKDRNQWLAMTFSITIFLILY